MMVDLTVIISLIIATLALISSFATAIINNRYQLKLKKFENYDLAKIKAFETFAQNIGNHIVVGNGNTQKNAINSLYGLLPFFNILKEDLNKLTNAIDRNDFVKYAQDLISKLNEQIKPNKQSLIIRIFHTIKRTPKNQ